MKKISKFFLLLILLMAGMSHAWAAGYNGESHVYLNLNGTTKYYKVSTESWATGSSLPGTWGGVFADQTLGILTTLKIDGGAVGGWTNYGESLSGSVDYKVYPKGGSGSYSGSPKSFDKNSSYSGNNTFRYNNTWYKDILPTDAGVYSLQVKVKGGSTNYESSIKDFTVPGFTLTSTSQTDYEAIVGEDQSKNISFTQHYGTALTTDNCELSGTDADQFLVTAISETEVTVKFAPASEGSKEATLTITDAHNKTCTISLSGTAAAPAATTWTVKFNPNGGKWSDESTTTKEVIVDKGSAITLVTPTKDGYTFTGWWDATSGGTKVIEPTATSYTPEANKTVHAQWIERTITLQKSDYNGLKQEITLTASNPTGFTPNTYTFYYSTDGGTNYTAIGEASAEASTTYTPTAAGSYTFKVVASDGTYDVEATTEAVTCNIPAYLVYATGDSDWNAKATASAPVNDIICVTIEGANLRGRSNSSNDGKSFFAFRIDDATGWTAANLFGSTSTTADEEVKTDGTATNSKINPSKGLYIKPGTDKADYTFTFSFNITNAQVSVTKTHKPVTVTYDANNATEGTVPMDDTQYEVGATVTVKENSGDLVRTGYTYDGWNTKNDGTGTSYSAVEPLGTFEITTNTTLYAKWNPITYYITYNVPEGASKGDNPDTYNIESAKITLKAASMAGKVFDGWFTEPEFTNQVTEIAKGSTGDRTLYAKFHDTQTYRLYYSNPENWATVNAYLWQNSGSEHNVDWPGEAITANTVVINNRTFYYVEFDETHGWDRVIFNNGASTGTLKTGDITFSAETNNNQYNNSKKGETNAWQNLPEPIDPETPYTTVKVLCDYSSNVKIFFLNKSEDFMVLDAEEDGTSSEYLMNALGEQTIDEKTGYLYEVSFYGTSKMAIFVSSSHIGDNNKLTANDVDLTKAAKVTYYYDLTGVEKGKPKSDTFSKIWVPLTQGYGTFCYPQAVQVSQAVPFWMQIQENQDETSGYELMMTAMEDNILPANTGALIYSKQQNAQAILSVVESTVLYEDNDFLGTTERTAMPTNLGEGEKVFVLGNGKDGIAFYNYQPTSGYIPAYKAYFRLTPKEEPQGAPSRVKMTFRTEPASPTNLETTKSTINNQQSKILRNGRLYILRNGVTYTISGQILK